MACPGRTNRSGAVVGGAIAVCLALIGGARHAVADELPVYLRDRGTGIATSLFGTYVRKGELLVYPFYEYTLNKDQEYKPSELGYSGESDFRGRFTEHEALIFLSYGLSDRIAFELESAVYSSATLEKASDDPSALPSSLEESGFGDTQAEIRWRWSHETSTRPELWSYFEAVFPLQKDKVLIGTQDWELVAGFGAIKGFRIGTFSARVSATYSDADKKVILGEIDAEYLKKFSRSWRGVLSVEGEEDEWSFIAEAQWHLSPRAYAKFNSGFGITSKAPDIAPEVGVVFSF